MSEVTYRAKDFLEWLADRGEDTQEKEIIVQHAICGRYKIREVNEHRDHIEILVE